MARRFIDSQDLPLGKAFDDFYVVPSYQREYVWEDEHIDQFLFDIYEAFSDSPKSTKNEYFIGSIVVCNKPVGVFELIDGQQRITTVFLILCAFKHHLRDINPKAKTDKLTSQVLDVDMDSRGRDVHRYRVRLQYEDSHRILEKIAEGRSVEEVPPETRSVRNIINAYNRIRSFLKNKFKEDEKRLREFHVYLSRNVKLVRIRTVSVPHALKVFETINDRGVGLNSMDLLRNLMFMKTNKKDFDRLKRTWENLVNLLYKKGENQPLRFFRYFIFASYNVEGHRLRQGEIYSWFVKNEKQCGYKDNPIGFVNKVLKAAKVYTNFMHGKDTNGNVNTYLTNIRLLSTAARQHLILLMATKHLPQKSFEGLCKHLENLFFAYIVTREPAREFERLFAIWAPKLREIKNATEFDKFVINDVENDKRRLAQRFEWALGRLTEESLMKYQIRYVLAKLTQYVNDRVTGRRDSQTDLNNYIKGVDIEHIFPQNPTQALIQELNVPERIREVFTIRLGNLTLLEKSFNSSIGRKGFKEKKVVYRESSFWLTKLLAGEVVIGDNTALNRFLKEFENLKFYEGWGRTALSTRQKLLVELAHKVWEMPKPERDQQE